MDSKVPGQKVREYRKRSGWSLEECAEKIGISARYLSDIERGDKFPKLETFVRILNIFAASADDVLQDSLVIGDSARLNNETITKLSADMVAQDKSLDQQTGMQELTKKLSVLDIQKQNQFLEIMEAIITSLEKN